MYLFPINTNIITSRCPYGFATTDLSSCLGPAFWQSLQLAMAPIEDASVDALRDLVRKLETRVEQLESKLEQTTGGSSTRKQKVTAGIRMILMGPPGAGIF